MTTLRKTPGDKVVAAATPIPANPSPQILAFEDEVASVPAGLGNALNITGVYEDSVTRDWAMQTCRAGTQRAGEERIRKTWYNVNSLCDPRVLQDAVRAAIVADIIVVSVYAAGELPLGLYVWIDVWLPRRQSRAGALTALIGVTARADPQTVGTHEYLQAVARKGQLQYFPQVRKRPAAFPVSPIALIAEQASTTAQVLQHSRSTASVTIVSPVSVKLPRTSMRVLRPKR